MDKIGLTHVYYGYGKGKTTCALGLSVRASGRGYKVVIVQFLKDMLSGELAQFEKLDNIRVIRGTACPKFVKDMTPEELEETRSIHNGNLREALALVEAGECDMLVLDELLDAIQLDVLDEQLISGIICEKPEKLELVITGHEPVDWVMERADYITEMVKHRHPYDRGITARKGIEL